MIDIRELKAQMAYAQNMSRLNVFNSMICFKNKTEFITEYATDTYTDYEQISIFNESSSNSKSFASYDFTGHDPETGASNKSIAQIILNIFEYSKFSKGEKTITNMNNNLYSGTKFGANMAKYEQTKFLLEELERMSNKPNFIKLTYAVEKVGRYNGRPMYSFYAEMKIPDNKGTLQTYWLCWHLERLPKKPATVRICDFFDKYNCSAVTKLGKKRQSDYDVIEKTYMTAAKQKKGGKITLGYVADVFDIEK